MKFLINKSLLIISAALLFSCSENDVMLYHPEPENPDPEKAWYLETVKYPGDNALLAKRPDFTLSYDSDFAVNQIKDSNGEILKVDKKEGWVIYSKITQSQTGFNTYDSVFVKLDNNKRAEYALHGTYSEYLDDDGNPKIEQTNMDYTAFIYDGDNYLTEIRSYATSDVNADPLYTEIRTISDGNIVNIVSSSDYKYSYTYNDQEYNASAEFCYEMPQNTQGLLTNNCLTLSNLVFMSEYLGERNKNNISGVVIERFHDIEYVEYANLSFEYTFADDLLSQMKMSGTINNGTFPDNNIVGFSYKEVEK